MSFVIVQCVLISIRWSQWLIQDLTSGGGGNKEEHSAISAFGALKIIGPRPLGGEGAGAPGSASAS